MSSRLTMRSIILGVAAAAMLTSGACLAQNTQGSNTQGMQTNQGMQTTPGTRGNNMSGTNGNNAQGNQAAASGNTNQAVATTSANATQPAKGANSFTQGQARDRIENEGYSNVSGLSKDANGVWRGKAEKNGQQTTVWLDYKGNVACQ